MSEKKTSNKDIMKQGVSLIVTDGEGKTIATMISSIADKNSAPLPNENSSCSLYLLRTAITRSAGSPEELFEKKTNVEKVYYIDYITVHPEYRRRGIAARCKWQPIPARSKSSCSLYLACWCKSEPWQVH